jgi:signal transduction histidine kinase
VTRATAGDGGEDEDRLDRKSDISCDPPVEESLFDEIKRFAGFTDEDSRRLLALMPAVAPHAQEIADKFYARLLDHEEARAVFTEGEAQVRRLKGTLADWLTSLFRGPHDQEYFKSRWRIGNVHVRIRLPERYVFVAMNLVRRELHGILDESPLSEAGRRQGHETVDRILDLELAIITESYQRDYTDRIMRQGRLAAIGQIAASVNHEIRNPLGVINTSVYAMRRILEKAGAKIDGIDRHLDKIDRSLRRSHKIVNDLLDFARGRSPERKQVELKQILDEAVQLASVPPGIRAEIRVEEPSVTVFADPLQLTNVILNLVENACHAMGASGDLVLSAATAGDRVTIDVRDTGTGIPAANLPLVFEPLFTTKSTGTGLGLSIARNIVTAHGGTIDVVSSTERGTTVRIALPADERR